MMRVKQCPRCKNATKKVHGYCSVCHADYMREWRKTHPLNAKQRKKDIARSYLNVYVRRGKVKRLPCEICGQKAEAHHEDYSKPLEVVWLCRKHHLQHHK